VLTDDERLVLSMTITLHGFELWEQFDKTRGLWRPLIIGKVIYIHNGQSMHEAVMQWIAGDQIAPTRSKVAMSHRWQRLPWSKLSDHQLQAFYNTVVSTC
jgi:hypothetical protein